MDIYLICCELKYYIMVLHPPPLRLVTKFISPLVEFDELLFMLKVNSYIVGIILPHTR